MRFTFRTLASPHFWCFYWNWRTKRFDVCIYAPTIEIVSIGLFVYRYSVITHRNSIVIRLPSLRNRRFPSFVRRRTGVTIKAVRRRYFYPLFCGQQIYLHFAWLTPNHCVSVWNSQPHHKPLLDLTCLPASLVAMTSPMDICINHRRIQVYKYTV